jgi:hypothetical protein
VASVDEKVVIRTKKEVFVAEGLVTPESWKVEAVPGVIVAAVRVMYGAPWVELFSVNPVAGPV